MDFYRTSVSQRTRFQFDKFYKEYNEKKRAAKISSGDCGGDGSGESVGGGGRGRVSGEGPGKSGKGLRGGGRVGIDVNSRKIGKCVKARRESGKNFKRGKNGGRSRLIDESDDVVELSQPSESDPCEIGTKRRSGSVNSNDGAEETSKTREKKDRGTGSKRCSGRGKSDDGGVGVTKLSKSFGRDRSRTGARPYSASGRTGGDNDDRVPELIQSSGKNHSEIGNNRFSVSERIDDHHGGTELSKCSRRNSSETGIKFDNGKNDDDGVVGLNQRPGRNSSETGINRSSGRGKRGNRVFVNNEATGLNNDCLKVNKDKNVEKSKCADDEFDNDYAKFFTLVELGKNLGSGGSKSEIDRCFEEMKKLGRGSSENKTTAPIHDGSKRQRGRPKKSKKDSRVRTRSHSNENTSGSSGYSAEESEDDEGVTYLGDNIECLDECAPSNSSRVEGNEVKEGFAELESLGEDDGSDDDDSANLESFGEDDVDTSKLESSEEDYDDSSDKDFTATSSRSSSDIQDESESSENEDDVIVQEKVTKRPRDGINNGIINDVGFKKSRTGGFLDSRKEAKEQSFGLSSHLRSRSVPLSKSDNKLNPGAIQPIPIDVSSYEDESDGGNNGYHRNSLAKSHGKGFQNAGKCTSIKHNHIDVIKILTDSIREEGNGDKLLKKYVGAPEETPVNRVVSYNFRFEDEDHMKPEKSELEMEADELFCEMNMCLQLLEIGSSGVSAVDKEDADLSVEETDQAILCSQGKHKLVLNDQFGIMCRCCSHVEMEIRDILPPLGKNKGGGRDRYDFDKADSVKFSDLHWQDYGHENRYGSKIYEKGTVWDLIPGVKETLYPHQCEGFEFIWKKIAGGTLIEKLEKHLPDGGSGCIISHAPGTGKSRLTIVFLQAFMKMYPSARPLIIAPRGMLLTWEEEFKKWNAGLKFHNMNNHEFSGQEHTMAANLLKRFGNSGKTPRCHRLLKLLSWKREASILGITYRLFEKLVGEGKDGSAKHEDEEEIKKILLRHPTLLVLDEGHTPRNNQSLVWNALLSVKTKRCIILSGTPFQNNFDELYNTLCLVNPLLSYGISSYKGGYFSRKRGRKSNAARGQWDFLTSSVKKGEEKLAELRSMIDPFVHVHKGIILQKELPGLKDALVVLKPTGMQRILLEAMRGKKCSLENDHLMSLISVHPSLLPKNLPDKEKFYKLIKGLHRKHQEGVKTEFLIELIKLSEALNEKVLVFSQYLMPLEFIKELFKTVFDWVEGREFLYMDGQQEGKLRQSSISSLNDPKSEVKVLLASLRACSEGINLVGASRVVLLDVHWNPSVERQAISRAYRLGQKKIVHVYHLVTGSMEGEKYVRQVEKSHLSELVFSSRVGSSSDPIISPAMSEDKILEAMLQHGKLKHIFEKVIFQPKEQDLIETFGLAM